MTEYRVYIYRADLNYLEVAQGLRYTDYDSVQNLIGYMTEGSDNILIRIEKKEVCDEQ